MSYKGLGMTPMANDGNASAKQLLTMIAQLGGIDLERDGLEVEIGGETYTVKVDADRLEFILGGKGGTRAPVADRERPQVWLRVLGYRSLAEAERLGSAELRRRHRKLSLQHHPDRGGTSERQQQVNDAVQAAKQHFGWD